MSDFDNPREETEAFVVKVTNRLTGEITEVMVRNASEAKNLYLELSANKNAIERATDQLKSFLDQWLGEDEDYQFADGTRVRRVQRERRTWTIHGLRAAGLDEDAIDTATGVNMTVARQIVREMVERGEIKPNAGKVLDETAEVSATKPFLEIR